MTVRSCLLISTIFSVSVDVHCGLHQMRHRGPTCRLRCKGPPENGMGMGRVWTRARAWVSFPRMMRAVRLGIFCPRRARAEAQAIQTVGFVPIGKFAEPSRADRTRSGPVPSFAPVLAVPSSKGVVWPPVNNALMAACGKTASK
jgi:hypothetical protein